MRDRPFQYWLRHLVLLIAAVGLVLGAARGALARVLLVTASVAVVGASFALLGYILIELLRAGPSGAVGAADWVARLPGNLRQRRFERRLAQLRRGFSSKRILALLGPPARIQGFGDRIYWSYEIADQCYTVSLDPKKLVACRPRSM